MDKNSAVNAAPLRRQAKIVCTIGPASDTEEMMRELMLRGMNVARLNFSHGSHEDHARVIRRLRKVSRELERTICILQDLQGPKIRTGRLKDRTPIVLEKGRSVTITAKDIMGTAELISTTYQGLARDVKPGEHILLSDGRIELVVKNISGAEVICEVLNGGALGEHQGINLPGTNVSIPSLTEKDEKDLAFGLKHAVDVVAISFVRTADDIVRARRAIAAHGGAAPVIAKLEKPQAIDNLESILEVSNGVMVARGDLRVEASDVANAIFDGTDAVMLSGETAVGKYPREAVEMMARIVAEAEAHPFHRVLPEHRQTRQLFIAETICESMAHAAQDLNIRAIAVFTETATTARMLSKYRPAAGIYAFTHVETVCNRMNLLWGVTPLRCPAKLSVSRMAEFAEQELVRLGALSPGDVFGLIAGTTGTSGATNFMRLITAGDQRK